MEGFKEVVCEFDVLERIASEQIGHIANDERLHGGGYQKLFGEAKDIVEGKTALPEEKKAEKLRVISATLRDIIRTNVPDDVLKTLEEFTSLAGSWPAE